MNGAELGVFAFDVAVLDEGDEGFLEGEGAAFFGEGNFLVEMLEGVVANVMARAVADEEEFRGGDAATGAAGEERLREDGGEGHGEFLANGVLAVGGEGFGDASDGGGDVHGVKRGEDEMAGFGGGDGDAHGFGVAHFADDDDVGSLAKGGAESGGKVGGVGTDFDLLDDAADVGVLVFDGVFDGDDVAGFVEIDFVNERGEGSGFAGARGATDQDQTARKMRERGDGSGKMELLQRGDASGKSADGRGGATSFAMEIDAEAAGAANAVGRVGDAGLAVLIEGVGGESGEDGGFDVGAVDGIGFDFAEFALDADAGRSVFDEEEIAAGAGDEGAKPVIETSGGGGIGGGGGAAVVELPDEAVEFRGIIHSGAAGGSAERGV